MSGAALQSATRRPTPHLKRMCSLFTLTRPSGKMCTHSPRDSRSTQKSIAGWCTPAPRTTGTHLPSAKKHECSALVKQMSCAASDQRMRAGRVRLARSSTPQRPGSSKQEWWLETVSRGWPRGRRTAAASVSRLYTVVLFRNSKIILLNKPTTATVIELAQFHSLPGFRRRGIIHPMS
ncbi:unnamed protein product [Spodoptera exigua]|nr:unnamed protein product [Spodoptera exigua]